MTSNINPNFPRRATPSTESVRNNFARAKEEIEELQANAVQKDYVDRMMAGFLIISATEPPVQHGKLWWNNASGNLYIGFKNQWVIAISPVREAQ